VWHEIDTGPDFRPVVRLVLGFYGRCMAREPKIRQVSPGVWGFRFTYGTDPLTGKRITSRIRVPGSIEDARQKLRELQHRKNLRQHPVPSITLSEVREMWDESTQHQGRRRVSTARIEESAYVRMLEPLLGHLPLYLLSAEVITRAYDELLRRWNPGAVRRLHQQLSSILTWASERGYCEVVATSRVRAPRVERQRVVAPSVETVRFLLDSVEDDQFWLVCRLAASLGLRRAEIVGLKVGDVNFAVATIDVLRSVTVERGLSPYTVPTKTGERGTGTLGLDSELLESLRSLRQRLLPVAVQLGVPVEEFFVVSGSDPLVPVRPDSLTHRMRSHVNAHEPLRGVTLHSLRRFVATTLVESGVDMATAGLVLRHTDSSTTAQHYVAPRAERARRVSASIGELLSTG